jgi:hypothetical protein
MFQENAESIPPEIGNAERFFENIKKIPDLKGPYHDFTSKDIEVHLDIKVDQNIPQNSFSFEPPKGVREFGLFDFDWDANQQKLR